MLSWLKRVLYGSEIEVETLPCTLQQFLYADNNYKKKCLFIDAEVAVTPEALILVNSAFTGEQDDLEKLRFPIDFSMDLTCYKVIDDDLFIWGFKWRNLDQDGPIKARLVGVEFVEAEHAQLFKIAICKAIHATSQPGQVFDEQQIAIYCEDEGTETFSKEAQLSNPLEHSLLVATNVEAPPIEIPELQADEAKKHEFTAKESMLLYLQTLYSLEHLLFVSAAHLYEHDPATGTSILTEKDVCFLLVKPRKSDFSIEIVRGTSVFIKHRLTLNFVYNIDLDTQEIMWAEDGNPPHCRLVRLRDHPGQLKDQLMHCLFELSKGQTVEEALKTEDLKLLRPVSYPALEEDVERNAEPLDLGVYDSDWEVVNSDAIEDDVNTLSTQSVHYDRTFVSRGHVISIYQEQKDTFQRLFDMPPLEDLDNVRLTPEVVQLHNQDRNLLILSKNRQFVYNIDVERGQVVDEWLAEAKMKLQDLAPTKKYGGQTLEPTFYAIAPKTVALIDPRVSEHSKIVKAKTYQKSYLFSAVASSVQGNLAVGSINGEIRLYKEVGKNAVNMFPGLGEGITSIEVSPSGHWVLATTPTALHLLPVGNVNCSGFREHLGGLKQDPKRLTLKPQDVARYCLSELNFTAAKFDNCLNWRESSIVTTTGNLMVTWNMSGVARGNLHDYRIKQLDEHAIDAQFIYGRRDVVVTMPTRVQLQRAKA